MSLTFEGKRYFNAERINAGLAAELYEVATAPTLEYERSITEDSSAALNSNDIYGGLVRADIAAKPGAITPYASVAVFRDLDDGSLHFNRSPETIVHPLAGIEVHESWGSIIANAGGRWDIRDGQDYGADRQIHGDVLAKVVLPHEFHVDGAVSAESYHWGVNEFQQEDYLELESAVGISYGSHVTITWFTDYTTNGLVKSTGNLAPAVYGAAEVQVKPIDSLTIKAFYGAYKAGIRCSGGQCRQLPGFDGARLSLVAAF